MMKSVNFSIFETIHKYKKINQNSFTMNFEEQTDNTIYRVVVNHEEQYSIWPSFKEIPLGWHEVGKEGNKQDCLDYIKEVWTDMRPSSLRKKMES
jgi:MbtH protein